MDNDKKQQQKENVQGMLMATAHQQEAFQIVELLDKMQLQLQRQKENVQRTDTSTTHQQRAFKIVEVLDKMQLQLQRQKENVQRTVTSTTHQQESFHISEQRDKIKLQLALARFVELSVVCYMSQLEINELKRKFEESNKAKLQHELHRMHRRFENFNNISGCTDEGIEIDFSMAIDTESIDSMAPPLAASSPPSSPPPPPSRNLLGTRSSNLVIRQPRQHQQR